MPCQNNILFNFGRVVIALQGLKKRFIFVTKITNNPSKVKHNAEIYPRLFASAALHGKTQKC
jgi:hypothetical protein